MKSQWRFPAIIALIALSAFAGEELFQDNFSQHLGSGWSWIREHREAWRVSKRGLEVRIEPGNMWGKANDAKNVLVRPAPDTKDSEVEITVTVENHPTSQYEQVDLVWYYDDSHMVKIGEELVDGKLSVVMGREEADKTRTIKIHPLTQTTVTLRLTVQNNRIRGQCRPQGSEKWQEVGECDLPAPTNTAPKISLQFYQGAAEVEHWACVREFSVKRTPTK